MMDHSFEFCGVDFRSKYGIVVERVEETLQPALRPRKITVPGLDGAIDQGAKYRDERVVDVLCGAINLTRAQCRELAYDLSLKGRFVRWDESDKYYIGRIYDPSKIEQMVQAGKKFVLTFVCDPFAYGSQVTENFTNAAGLEYAGTARTPTYITITNPNNYALLGLQIIMREKKI